MRREDMDDIDIITLKQFMVILVPITTEQLRGCFQRIRFNIADSLDFGLPQAVKRIGMHDKNGTAADDANAEFLHRVIILSQ
jgi:hypothetical protein